MGNRLQRLTQTRSPLPGQRKWVVRAVIGDGLLAGPDLADDVDVLAGSGQWFGKPLAVPALDDLGSGHSQAEDVPSAAEVVERQRCHRAGGRGSRGELNDGCAEPNAAR